MSFEQPIGVIGTGLMGEVFARRFVGAGFGVVGFDVDPAKAARLRAFGGHAAGTIADVVRAANVIACVGRTAPAASGTDKAAPGS